MQSSTDSRKRTPTREEHPQRKKRLGRTKEQNERMKGKVVSRKVVQSTHPSASRGRNHQGVRLELQKINTNG